MKRKNGIYVPSKTEKEKAMGHCLALAKKAGCSGTVECWFNKKTGTFLWFENVGNSYMESDGDDVEYIGTAQAK